MTHPVVFHQATNLVPEDQVPLTLDPDTSVRDALALLEDTGFSQLPVVRGSAIVGSFSYRSFARRAPHLQRLVQDLLDVPVGECMEVVEIARATDDLESLFPALERDGVVLVGSPYSLEGIITETDLRNYLYELVAPFLQLGEIELALRAVLHHCFQPAELATLAKTVLATSYEGRLESIPEAPEAMTLGELIALLRDGRGYSSVSPLLGSLRQVVASRLAPLPGIRNDIFHFRGELAQDDRDKLVEARAWIVGRLRGTSLEMTTEG
jgi:CBS domain-containing protein